MFLFKLYNQNWNYFILFFQLIFIYAFVSSINYNLFFGLNTQLMCSYGNTNEIIA